MDGLLRFKGKLVVGSGGTLRSQILTYMHASSVEGHSGVIATFQRAAGIFWWPGLRGQVQQYVAACHVCQLSKHENVHSLGLLKPLPVPEQAWSHITMDFIE